MNITNILTDKSQGHGFSIEVLPPLKGNGTDVLFRNIDKLKDFGPHYINITTHHSEYVYREVADGQYERLSVRRRPGTIAIAAAIQRRYDIPVIPHVICSGATKEDIESSSSTCSFLASATSCSFGAIKPRKTVCSLLLPEGGIIPRSLSVR